MRRVSRLSVPRDRCRRILCMRGNGVHSSRRPRTGSSRSTIPLLASGWTSRGKSVEKTLGRGSSNVLWSRLVLRRPPSHRLRVPRSTDDAGRGSRDQVVWLSHSRRCARRITPSGSARSPCDVQRRNLRSRRGGLCRTDREQVSLVATGPGHPDRRLLRLTNSTASNPPGVIPEHS